MTRESICESCPNSVELEYGTKACKLITRLVGNGRREPCPRLYQQNLQNKERGMCPEKKWGPPKTLQPVKPSPPAVRVVSENTRIGYRKVSARNYYLSAKEALKK